MSYGTRGGSNGPPPEANSRVTDAERFRPLHAAMQESIARLYSEYHVTQVEAYGLDEELERHMTPSAPTVRLTPNDGDAAPITIVFSDFHGLHVRFGRWLREPFPDCGCDACDESAEGEIERLIDIVDDVTAGRFRKGIRIPLQSSAAWRETETWAYETRLSQRNTGIWSRGRSRIDRQLARSITGGARRFDLYWKPWPGRQTSR